MDKYEGLDILPEQFNGTKLEKDFGIDENALAYLLGEGSCYNSNEDFVYELPVQVVAAAMSNISRKCTPARSRAV